VTASIEASTSGAAPAGASACARISEFARGLHDLAGSDPAAVLAQIPPAAIALIPGTRYAAISGTRGATMRCLCSSDRCVRALDQIQQDHRQGPYFDLPWQQRILQVADLSTDIRWQVFAPVAVALTPIRSLLSFQLLTAHSTMVLNLYADTPNAFTGRCVQLGQIFALDIAVALDAVHRHSGFTHRLALRDLIGQAKGILMQRFGIDHHAALHMLTEMAHHRNQSVAEIARHLIATRGVRPPPDTPWQ
jgi:ANTAR domain